MHIVFVTTELAGFNHSSGGLASFTANMARIFAEHGHHVSVVLSATRKEHIELGNHIVVRSSYIPMQTWTKMDKIAKFICKLNKNVSKRDGDIRIAIMKLYKTRQVKSAIREIGRREKIDMIHYCNHGSFSRISNKKIPYVVRISGFLNIWQEGADTPDGSIRYEDNPLSWGDRLENRALRKSRYVVSPSYFLAGILQENLGIKATVIESPFVLNKEGWDYAVFHKYLLKKKYVIHYGSLKYLKGTHIVAQLAEKLLRQYPDLWIVAAGRDGELVDEKGNKIKSSEFMKQSAGEFSGRVLYAGALPREQLYPLIENAEVCLLPSRVENLPNACIEAMAMGKIVVATNGVSFEQLIEDRVSGFLCERDNPDSYFHAIQQALAMSAEEKSNMELRAREAIERLNPEKIYKQYLAFYEKVIEEW